ncbi:hypothetical protein Aglo01_47880 [Actinokineospora globicatena]|nr:hypothetical protein Aglo01_47880 [Actinokineospora globicatena]GLW87135.1 hypothetical protein Aglo02_47740 [Actinokineospora globicatena]
MHPAGGEGGVVEVDRHPGAADRTDRDQFGELAQQTEFDEHPTCLLTVGMLNPVCSPMAARESGPSRRITASTAAALVARTLGRRGMSGTGGFLRTGIVNGSARWVTRFCSSG